MKILIDARFYGIENAGPGRYTKNLIDYISKCDKDNKYFILLRKKHFNDLKLEKNFEKILADFNHYTFREQWELPRIISKHKPDLVHFPFFNVPILYFGSYVATIHDLTMHKFSGRDSTTRDYPSYLMWRFGYHLSFLKSVYNSKKIIVPSKAVKEDIVRTYKVNDKKIHVIYEGVDQNFSMEKQKKSIKSKYKLSDKYFLYVGSAYPHKNLKRLLTAIKDLNESLDYKVELAISSSRNEFLERIKKMSRELQTEEYVKFLGFVSDEDLNFLYKESVGFVYPTLSEGFGLPALEAMQSGTLALVSNIAVLKEVYQNNAIYFDPKRPTSIKETMLKVLKMDKKERETKIKESQEFIKRYSWKKMAQETLEIYESLRKK